MTGERDERSDAEHDRDRTVTAAVVSLVGAATAGAGWLCLAGGTLLRLVGLALLLLGLAAAIQGVLIGLGLDPQRSDDAGPDD